MFEFRISAGATEQLPSRASGKHDAETISSWSYDMEGHAKKCVERYCELANQTTQQSYKVATPCMDDHQFKEEENGSVGELSTVCPQIVLKCLYLASTGRPDILWSVNKLVRAVTKWTKACDNLSHTFITHVNTGNIVMWATQHNNADWDCFRALILTEMQKTQNQHQGDCCAFSEVTRLCQ